MYQDIFNAKRCKKGYTLLEIMVAMLFFGIVALALCLPFYRSISLSVKDQDLVNANNLARLYLNDVKIGWNLQSDYDKGNLPTVDSTYTNNGVYTSTVTSTNMATDANGNVILRRIIVNYKDKSKNTLVELYSDYDRPGSTIQ